MNILQYALNLLASNSICTTQQALNAISLNGTQQHEQTQHQKTPVPVPLKGAKAFSYRGFRPYH